MKISANSIRAGHILLHENGLWVVSKTPEHTKPGKGVAYVQVEMKSIKTGTKVIQRLSSSDYVEKAQLEQRNLQFLYSEDENLVLMDNETFEQVFINKKIFVDKLPFLSDGMIITVEFHEETPIKIELPHSIIVEIEETDPVMKSATVTSSYKPAILTNGIKVMVPPYIVRGEKIVIKTEDLSFVERAK